MAHEQYNASGGVGFLYLTSFAYTTSDISLGIGSLGMCTIAMLHSSLFAGRSPHRLNRWRAVFPENDGSRFPLTGR
ncbi:MAG: hypothetical protein Q7T74_04205 [Candidatus Saccharibacteria bacterium]|nr:hypothetical protein [Candidatus Saccharibacteria bacterium]